VTALCSRDPCTRPASRRGMCASHYEQYRHRQKAYGRWESFYVDAEPARLHVKTLQAAGLGTRRIADLAGINRNNIMGLTNGRRGRGSGPPSQTIRRVSSERILAVPVPDVAHRVAKGNTVVPGVGTTRRLQALVAFGYTQDDLSRRIGWAPSNAVRLFNPERSPQVQARTARQVEALFRELQLIPGPSERARRHAQRKGWALPLAWDEDSIDDAAALPDSAQRSRPGFVDRYQDFRDCGYSDLLIATRMGIQPGSLLRMLDRHGLVASAELVTETSRRRAS
jgi:hypothetical protein